MDDNIKKARDLFLQGYNCNQSVVGAFCEDLGLDFETAMKISASFGGGMGRLREVCGAVSGIFFLAGLKYGYSSPDDDDTKAKHYKLIQDIAARFKECSGSIICRELLNNEDEPIFYIPTERTEEFYKERPCLYLVEQAAAIAKEVLDGKFKSEI